jgi:hypothetical protein
LKFDAETDVVWVIDSAVSQVSRGALSEPQLKGVINGLNHLYEDAFSLVDEWVERYGGRYSIELDDLGYYVSGWEGR